MYCVTVALYNKTCICISSIKDRIVCALYYSIDSPCVLFPCNRDKGPIVCVQVSFSNSIVSIFQVKNNISHEVGVPKNI